MTMSRRFVLTTALLCAATSAIPGAQAAQSHQSMIDRATAVLEDMRHDNQFGNSGELIGRARAVMVVPQLVKGGFIFGAEGGKSILMARTRGGGWSDPAFYGMGGGSFGLQIGVETAEVVMFVMTDRALKAWMRNEVKFGAEAGLTVLVVGSGAEAATAGGNADVIAWARTKGAYAGISFKGSVIKQDKKANARVYGRPISAQEIVLDGRGRPNVDVHDLKAALGEGDSRRSANSGRAR